jgi:hypothetical protein
MLTGDGKLFFQYQPCVPAKEAVKEPLDWLSVLFLKLLK